jgi:uncharacterized protein YdhG (YjbR/CyaY superfamily)
MVRYEGNTVETFEDYLGNIADESHRAILKTLLAWIADAFPNLEQKIAWNQPMFTDHGTFIIGFSASKEHFSFSAENPAMVKFADQIALAGYETTKKLVKVRWNAEVDYHLFREIIAFQIEDKAGYEKFWRE